MLTLKFDQKITLQEVIVEHEQFCNSFVEYLASIHAVEAFEFWIEVELYKRLTEPEECNRTAKFIFSTYLSPLSPNEINLEGRLRRELLETFSKNPSDPQLFNKAQESVEMMLKYDCLRVFLEVNKGKVKRLSGAHKRKGSKPESHTLLLHRYTSAIKGEKKKLRQSLKKSISGTIRRLTNEPKHLAPSIKSNSFTGTETRHSPESLDKTYLSDTALEEGEVNNQDEEKSTMKRARGRKIRGSGGRKITVAVSNLEESASQDVINSESTVNQNADKWVEYKKKPLALNKAPTGEMKKSSGVESGRGERSEETLGDSQGKEEDTRTEISESGSTIGLTKEGRQEDGGGRRRKPSGGARFLACFGMK